jgi:hypothetical protein
LACFLGVQVNLTTGVTVGKNRMQDQQYVVERLISRNPILEREGGIILINDLVQRDFQMLISLREKMNGGGRPPSPEWDQFLEGQMRG